MPRSLHDHSDIELFERLCGAKDVAEPAFAELYTRHGARVYAYCRRIIGDETIAQDMFQETFIRFYQSAQEPREMTNVPAYLLKIARNLCLNCLRDKRKSVAFEDYHKLSRDTPHEKTELMELIAMALEALQPEYKDAFVLREYEGLSYAEIAEVVDASLSTVKIRVHRAKQKIRELLAPYLADLQN